MRKTITGVSALFISICCSNVFAEESPHQFSGGVALVTEYLYRGISQTSEKAALQGSMEYAHEPSGFYVAAWGLQHRLCRKPGS